MLYKTRSRSSRPRIRCVFETSMGKLEVPRSIGDEEAYFENGFTDHPRWNGATNNEDGGGKKRDAEWWLATRERALIRLSEPPRLDASGPHRTPRRYGWLCKQDGRKVDRIARSRVTIIYLPAGPERRVSELTRILRPTKTPTQKFAWHRGRFTRVPSPPVGASERLA